MRPTGIRTAPKGGSADRSDDQRARWGRERHDGFDVGKYLQAPPMLFTADHHPVWLADMYRGRSAFLICGGPSFAVVDHETLRQPGMLTMALNNAARTFRPDLWVSVDSPDHFIRSVWLDPRIMKFVPICHTQKRIFDNNAWERTTEKVSDCPNVFYYKRNEHFQAKQFLREDTMNWGNHKKHGGGRSVMLVAVRLLFVLGVRRVFLLGADFTMNEQQKYHFEQERSASSIRGNNSTYEKLNDRFSQLRPLFEQEQFHVFNCNRKSGLKAFEMIDFDDAVRLVREEMGNIDIAHERTVGLYDQDKPPK